MGKGLNTIAKDDWMVSIERRTWREKYMREINWVGKCFWTALIQGGLVRPGSAEGVFQYLLIYSKRNMFACGADRKMTRIMDTQDNEEHVRDSWFPDPKWSRHSPNKYIKWETTPITPEKQFLVILTNCVIHLLPFPSKSRRKLILFLFATWKLPSEWWVIIVIMMSHVYRTVSINSDSQL